MAQGRSRVPVEPLGNLPCCATSTAEERLGLPDTDDVKAGIIAYTLTAARPRATAVSRSATMP